MNTNRTPTHPIEPLLLHRHSPRAMSGEPLSDKELMPLFEAARWAPSSYNDQPWMFLYAKKGTTHWDAFFNLLVEFNQLWCKNAAVLVVILSRKHFAHDKSPNIVHTFDAGAAWENLALQGSAQGLVVHGMAGFDYAKARTDLNIPDIYNVDAMCAIGKQGSLENLPERMRGGETPSGRKELKEIICEGGFK